jgi:hypothetical protein
MLCLCPEEKYLSHIFQTNYCNTLARAAPKLFFPRAKLFFLSDPRAKKTFSALFLKTNSHFFVFLTISDHKLQITIVA